MKNKKLSFVLLFAIAILTVLFKSYSNANNAQTAQASKPTLTETAFMAEGAMTDKDKNINLDELSAQQKERARFEAASKRVFADIEAVHQAKLAEVQNKELLPYNKPELEGRIRNEYGIRDDILHFIEDNVPESNEMARKAAIKAAQYSNQGYYHAKNQQEALEIFKKEMLAVSCLYLSLPEAEMVFDGIIKRMNDTPARDKHIWDVDRKYFGWHILGTGLTDSEEKKKCKLGDF